MTKLICRSEETTNQKVSPVGGHSVINPSGTGEGCCPEYAPIGHKVQAASASQVLVRSRFKTFQEKGRGKTKPVQGKLYLSQLNQLKSKWALCSSPSVPRQHSAVQNVEECCFWRGAASGNKLRASSVPHLCSQNQSWRQRISYPALTEQMTGDTSIIKSP